MTIVKQPNGKFANFSSIIDDFVIWDATKEEYIEFRKKELEKDLEETFKFIEQNGSKLKWKDALEAIANVHGKDHIKQYKVV